MGAEGFDVMPFLQNAGGYGLLIAYLFYKDREDRAERKERAEADKALAISLTSLAERISGLK